MQRTPLLQRALAVYAKWEFTRRERDGPQQFLEGFEGFLQADAYSGYDCIYAGERVQEVACWVHARRHWHRAVDNDPDRSNHALGFIARLSQIETQLNEAYRRRSLQGERDFASVAAGRQDHALPILAEFESWLTRNKGRVLFYAVFLEDYLSSDRPLTGPLFLNHHNRLEAMIPQHQNLGHEKTGHENPGKERATNRRPKHLEQAAPEQAPFHGRQVWERASVDNTGVGRGAGAQD